MVKSLIATSQKKENKLSVNNNNVHLLHFGPHVNHVNICMRNPKQFYCFPLSLLLFWTMSVCLPLTCCCVCTPASLGCPALIGCTCYPSRCVCFDVSCQLPTVMLFLSFSLSAVCPPFGAFLLRTLASLLRLFSVLHI